jgi:hypothetical protein
VCVWTVHNENCQVIFIYSCSYSIIYNELEAEIEIQSEELVRDQLNHAQASILIWNSVMHRKGKAYAAFSLKCLCSNVVFLGSELFLNWCNGGVESNWVHLTLAASNRPIVPPPGDYDDGETGRMIGKGNRSTRRKPATVPLWPPQTPHAAWTRTRAAAVGTQRLTAWATARP